MVLMDNNQAEFLDGLLKWFEDHNIAYDWGRFTYDGEDCLYRSDLILMYKYYLEEGTLDGYVFTR